MGRAPLNGTKAHPLSPHARDVLRDLSVHPKPCSEINPGVVNRLQREDLASLVRLPSPFKTHKGKLIDFLRITEAGLATLEQKEAER